MGCGSSSLKGDAQDVKEQEPQPAQRVATDFNTPDYLTPGTQRRNTEYGPRDQVQQKPSEADKSNSVDKTAIAQPATTSTNDAPLSEQVTSQAAGDDAAKKTPYKDVTSESPSSPVAPNAAATFSGSQATENRPAQ